MSRGEARVSSAYGKALMEMSGWEGDGGPAMKYGEVLAGSGAGFLV